MVFTEAKRIYDRASFFRDINHVSLNYERFSFFSSFFLLLFTFFYLKSFSEDFHPWQIDAVTGVVQVLVHAILSGHSGFDYSCLLRCNTVFFGLEMTDVSLQFVEWKRRLHPGCV